ncbi:hypothetical protein FACUT_12999 [Fusarium acutatum]|uniref:Uncharacterized protein n=1 Tax=Fusarium acutatum TaxID=78861 RepID=A0A8H4NEA5_9HYPO|nr:hypothetical protein FACUT_12999 [Fusarium acutatum]
MLKRMWYRRNNECDDPQRLHGPGTYLDPANRVASTQRDAETVVDASKEPQQAPMYQGDSSDHPERFNGIFGNGEFQSTGEDFLLGINESELPSVEEYLFGSFWPGITEFGIENEVGFKHQAEAQPASNSAAIHVEQE